MNDDIIKRLRDALATGMWEHLRHDDLTALLDRLDKLYESNQRLISECSALHEENERLQEVAETRRVALDAAVSEGCKAEAEVERLREEKEMADKFHAVAVAERNLAWFEVRELKRLLREVFEKLPDYITDDQTYDALIEEVEAALGDVEQGESNG